MKKWKKSVEFGKSEKNCQICEKNVEKKSKNRKKSRKNAEKHLKIEFAYKIQKVKSGIKWTYQRNVE